MALLPIYSCFHPILKKKTEKVDIIDENIKILIKDMFDTMYHADGIGLAANQVGVQKSIITIDVAAANSNKNLLPLVLINPEISELSEEEVEYSEGCLSVPTLHEIVIRPKIIQISYYDQQMREHKIEADELLARVIQHETDHLNGVLFYEKLTPLRRALARTKLKKIQRGQIVPDYEMIYK